MMDLTVKVFAKCRVIIKMNLKIMGIECLDRTSAKGDKLRSKHL